jgi:hypothetical protein
LFSIHTNCRNNFSLPSFADAKSYESICLTYAMPCGYHGYHGYHMPCGYFFINKLLLVLQYLFYYSCVWLDPCFEYHTGKKSHICSKFERTKILHISWLPWKFLFELIEIEWSLGRCTCLCACLAERL